MSDLTILGIVFSAFSGIIILMLNRNDGHIQDLNKKMDRQERRLDAHAGRIDQLYQMFVDLLKGKPHKQEKK